MKLFIPHDAAPILEWLHKTYGLHFHQHPRLIFGVCNKDGVLKGAYIISWCNDLTVELHVYGTVSLDTAKRLFRTIFTQYEIYRVQVMVRASDEYVRRNALKWGFTHEGTARGYNGTGGDAIMYGMLRDECRWIKERKEDGQRV